MEKGRAFSLTEVMVAAAISALVLALVSTLLIGMLKSWEAGSASLELSLQSRLARERLLSGIQGEFGLRHAARSSIVYTTNALEFRDSETSNRFTVMLETNQPLRVQAPGGTNVFATPATILLQSSGVAWASNVLTLDLVLSMDDGRRVWTQPQQMRVYLLND